MADYSFIDDLKQIRGVTCINKKKDTEAIYRTHIVIVFDMERQDEGDLDTLHGILHSQKSVDFTIEYIKNDNF